MYGKDVGHYGVSGGVESRAVGGENAYLPGHGRRATARVPRKPAEERTLAHHTASPNRELDLPLATYVSEQSTIEASCDYFHELRAYSWTERVVYATRLASCKFKVKSIA